ncbi:hypothetical protein FOZ63_011440, partial [Perkinsus olseni]
RIGSVPMTALCDRAELRRVTSSILRYLDSKMRGMPEDCLSEVWKMAPPQVEGLERASRISLFAGEGSGYPALQGGVFWRLDFDEESLKLVLAEGIQGTALCLHTTEEFLYVLCEEGHFYRIPRSADFIPDLSAEYRFTLRPWGADDRRGNSMYFATSCDNAYIYAATSDFAEDAGYILVEID